MKKSIVGGALLLGLGLATQAQAAVVICQTPNCTPGPEQNVLINAQPASPLITGNTNQTGTLVNFTSPIGEALVGNANGQSDVSAADGLLNGITFALAGGNTFGDALFNLFPLPGNQNNEAVLADIVYAFNGGINTQTIPISTNGQNDTGIFGTAGERFTSVTFRANPLTTGIQDLRQVRLSDVLGPGGVPIPTAGGVPEPATWAMLLVGFGIVGAAMRRRKQHQTVRLTYA